MPSDINTCYFGHAVVFSTDPVARGSPVVQVLVLWGPTPASAPNCGHEEMGMHEENNSVNDDISNRMYIFIFTSLSLTPNSVDVYSSPAGWCKALLPLLGNSIRQSLHPLASFKAWHSDSEKSSSDRDHFPSHWKHISLLGLDSTGRWFDLDSLPFWILN